MNAMTGYFELMVMEHGSAAISPRNISVHTLYALLLVLSHCSKGFIATYAVNLYIGHKFGPDVMLNAEKWHAEMESFHFELLFEAELRKFAANKG